MSRIDFSQAPLPNEEEEEEDDLDAHMNEKWAEQHKSFRGKKNSRFMRRDNRQQKWFALGDMPAELQADLDALSRGTVFMKSLAPPCTEKHGSPSTSGSKTTSNAYNFAFKFHDFPSVQTVCILRGTPDFSTPSVALGKAKLNGKQSGSDAVSPERGDNRSPTFFHADTEVTSSRRSSLTPSR